MPEMSGRRNDPMRYLKRRTTMRCNDCNKFVGEEPGLPENEEVGMVTSDGIELSFEAMLNCTECGAELRRGQFDVTVPIPEAYKKTIAKHEQDMDDNGEEHCLEIEVNFSKPDDIAKKGSVGRHLLVGMTLTVRCGCQEGEAPPANIDYEVRCLVSEMDDSQ